MAFPLILAHATIQRSIGRKPSVNFLTATVTQMLNTACTQVKGVKSQYSTTQQESTMWFLQCFQVKLACTVEPLTTDSPYYGNLHNAD